MAGAGLLALLDDIATVLDDVALMTKVATKKTAGLLSDDLALNAEQVSGVRAEREIPVVWAVAKGSAINKLILVPAALLLSTFVPWIIAPLLMMGGTYLCYEGFEKIYHSLLHSGRDEESKRDEITKVLMDPSADMVELERAKIKGAIRTDFILSAEIVVIALGTVQHAEFIKQLSTISIVAVLMTVGVYSLVAAIVKLDDAGLHLLADKGVYLGGRIKRLVGKGLIRFCPFLMRALSIFGTAAMFLVGGGILVHGLPKAHTIVEQINALVHSAPLVGGVILALTPMFINAVVGIIVGGLAVAVMSIGRSYWPAKNTDA